MSEDKEVYGIWSTVSKRFVFGIEEESKSKAWKKLWKKIGNDAMKWRFEARRIRRKSSENLQRD